MVGNVVPRLLLGPPPTPPYVGPGEDEPLTDARYCCVEELKDMGDEIGEV